MMLSDIVLEKPLPEAITGVVEAYVGCVAGAILRSDYVAMIEAAGFHDVRVQSQKRLAATISIDDPVVQEAIRQYRLSPETVREVLESVTSVAIFARK